ncbi:hypothetical protein CEXT_246471 [Caerostris extrusa]|uniref:Uncharacterized protein n=1 Tax=Caerostris extrusa TaxID=172846 RepID=A0AAV4XCC7_CAEEX|nr:hypothetical protein CEXT_246471 [Caerostris extrusa]
MAFLQLQHPGKKFQWGEISFSWESRLSNLGLLTHLTLAAGLFRSMDYPPNTDYKFRFLTFLARPGIRGAALSNGVHPPNARN